MTKAMQYINENFLSENFTLKEQEEFLNITEKIIMHEEFEKRCTEEYYHHGNTTLGEHIIKDTILTYRMIKIYKLKHPLKKINLEDALLISLFHDLYTNSWQNNAEKKSIIKAENHGFIHPVEAVINSYTWFPEYFKNKERREKLIDGILHHMYPFPVKKITTDTIINNQNIKKFKHYKFLIENTYNKTNIHYNIKKSKSIEGRIMSKADKKSAIKELKNIESFLALITGKNNSIIK